MILNHTNFIGYTKDELGKLVIVPHEAEVIKNIYSLFLDGYTITQIARTLERKEVLSPQGKQKWSSATIRSILTNEKYMGDCLLQKTVQPDFLNKKRIKNIGQAKQFYVENSHEGIVSKETYLAVKEELKRRKSIRSYTESGNGKYSSCYPFSGKLICTCCGSRLRRFQQNSRGNKKPVWVCINHQLNGAENCKMTPIREIEIENAFVRALNKLCGDKESCLKDLSNKTEGILRKDAGQILQDLDRQISERQSGVLLLNKQYQKKEITSDVYATKTEKIGEEIDNLNEIRLNYSQQLEKETYQNVRIDSISSAIKNLDIFDEFNEHIFRKLVTQVLIINPLQVEFDFNGIKILELL